MRSASLRVFSAFVLTLSVPALAAPKQSTETLSVKEITKRALPCVVLVTASNTKGETTRTTGFVATRDGNVVTNFAAIRNMESATVKFADGAMFPVSGVTNLDIPHDLVVLRLEANREFQAVHLGDSSSVEIGEDIVAVISPFSSEATVSDGLVSAIRSREHSGDRLFQITVPVSAENTGGPLFNSKGEVVGVTSAFLAGEQKLNIAVPAAVVKPLLTPNPPMPISEVAGTTNAAKLAQQRAPLQQVAPPAAPRPAGVAPERASVRPEQLTPQQAWAAFLTKDQLGFVRIGAGNREFQNTLSATGFPPGAVTCISQPGAKGCEINLRWQGAEWRTPARGGVEKLVVAVTPAGVKAVVYVVFYNDRNDAERDFNLVSQALSEATGAKPETIGRFRRGLTNMFHSGSVTNMQVWVAGAYGSIAAVGEGDRNAPAPWYVMIIVGDGAWLAS